MKNSEIFYGELQLIKDPELSDAVKKILDEVVPDYFYIVSASSTGKYHPWYSLGYGGLVRHTKAAVRIAYDLLQLAQYKHLNSDEIIAALILHDTFKHGVPMANFTVKEHPLIAASNIGAWISRTDLSEEVRGHFARICVLIKSHMGQWNELSNGDVLPIPITESQRFVHMCDYLASRKYIIVEVS